MARRRGFFRRLRRNRSGRKYFGKSRSRSKGVSPMKVVIAGGLYGAGRQYLVNLATPLTSMLGVAGGYADELVLGAAGYYLAKKSKGLLKNVGIAMLTIESASLGSQLIGGVSSGSGAGGWQ